MMRKITLMFTILAFALTFAAFLAFVPLYSEVRRVRQNRRPPLSSSGISVMCVCGTVTADDGISSWKRICRHPAEDLSITGRITNIEMHPCTESELRQKAGNAP